MAVERVQEGEAPSAVIVSYGFCRRRYTNGYAKWDVADAVILSSQARERAAVPS